MFMGHEVKALSPLFMVLCGVRCGKVYDGVVPGAGIERARFYWAHDSVGVILE